MPAPLLFRITLAAAWLAAATTGAVAATRPATARPDSALAQALRSRALTLSERQQVARTAGGVPLDSLARAFGDLATEARAVGLDTLAFSASMRAATLLRRQDRMADAERRMAEAVADAMRAKDPASEITARLYLLDWKSVKQPEVVLEALRSLAPRVRRLGSPQQLAELHATESAATMQLGRPQESLAAAKRAAAEYRRAESLEMAASMMMRASQALRFLERHAEVLPLTDSVLAMAKRQPLGASVVRAWTERGSALVTLGRYDEAIAAYDEALAGARRLGDVQRRIAVHRFRARLFLNTYRFRECLAELDSLAPFVPRTSDRTLAITVAELRAAALIELRRPEDAEATLVGTLDEHEAWLGSLDPAAQATSAEMSSFAYTVLARSRLLRDRIEDAWRASERGRARALKRERGLPAVPDLAALRAELARTRTALVQFDDPANGRGNVFVISGARIAGWTLEHPYTPQQTRALLREIARPPATRANVDVHARFATALLARVWKELPPGIERLAIVPPSDAEALLFETAAAPASAELPRVGDRWNVSYLPAAGLLPRSAESPRGGRGLVVVAAPDPSGGDPEWAALDAAVRGRLARPLAGAREEARRFGEGARRVLAGRDATIARLADAGPCGWLHVAAHAIEHPALAPNGALVVAGSPALLTPARVDSLRISADLVTLSGCRTLGSIGYGTEGVVGLARAFLATGARTVVTTRWDVGDRAAARFMELFRASLLEGRSRDESFTRAGRQLEIEGFPPRDRWAFQLLGAGAPGLPAGVSAAGTRWLGRLPGLPK